MQKKIFILILSILLISLLFFNQTKKKPPEFIIDQTLNFEDATVNKDSIFTNGQIYSIHSSTNSVWLETKLSRKGSNSLAFQLHPGESRKELKVLDIPNNTVKYIAFSVYFPLNYKVPTDWNLIAQWWQGSPASPPIAFEINSNSNEFQLRILTRDGTSQNFNLVSHYIENIEKDEWIDFIIKLRVNDNNDTNGLLKVWKNKNLIVDYSGRLGYSDLNDNTNFRIGLYRSPKINTTVEAYYDEVLIGDHLE
ncbi:heparin lyase I family protein [Peribacillus simplex]